MALSRDRHHLELIVARLDRLAAEPGGGSDADWQAVWQLIVDAGPSHEAPTGSGPAAPQVTASGWAAIVDAELGRARHRLVAYGTLQPGESNHHLVAGLGSWQPATVRGEVGDWEGYPILRPRVGGPEVPVMVLTAAGLPGRMGDLDEFEGPAYRRSWVVAETGGPGARRPVVAQCYIDAREADAGGDRGPRARR